MAAPAQSHKEFSLMKIDHNKGYRKRFVAQIFRYSFPILAIVCDEKELFKIWNSTADKALNPAGVPALFP